MCFKITFNFYFCQLASLCFTLQIQPGQVPTGELCCVQSVQGFIGAVQYHRLSNHPDLISILPILLEDPESRPICDPDFDICCFKMNSYDTLQEHLTEFIQKLSSPNPRNGLLEHQDSNTFHGSMLPDQHPAHTLGTRVIRQ